jgi:hypothetical protein
MYDINFPPQSNRASWLFVGQITDYNDDPLDLTGCSMVFAITDAERSYVLQASTEIGNLTFPDTGTFRWFFTVDDMQRLCVGQHRTGLTLTNDDGTQTLQLAVGPLPIVDGGVPLV